MTPGMTRKISNEKSAVSTDRTVGKISEASRVSDNDDPETTIKSLDLTSARNTLDISRMGFRKAPAADCFIYDFSTEISPDTELTDGVSRIENACLTLNVKNARKKTFITIAQTGIRGFWTPQEALQYRVEKTEDGSQYRGTVRHPSNGLSFSTRWRPGPEWKASEWRRIDRVEELPDLRVPK